MVLNRRNPNFKYGRTQYKIVTKIAFVTSFDMMFPRKFTSQSGFGFLFITSFGVHISNSWSLYPHTEPASPT